MFFPGVMQNAYDSIATDGVQGLKREMNESLNNIRLKNSAIDDASNTYGVSGKNRVTFSNNYMLDANLVTKDGINAIIQWSQQYEINQSMEEANLIVSPAIDFLREGISQVTDPLQKKQLQKKMQSILKAGKEKKITIPQEFVQIWEEFAKTGKLSKDDLETVNGLLKSIPTDINSSQVIIDDISTEDDSDEGVDVITSTKTFDFKEKEHWKYPCTYVDEIGRAHV